MDPKSGTNRFRADCRFRAPSFEETFWAVRFGMLVDRFGIPWMVNVGKEQ